MESDDEKKRREEDSEKPEPPTVVGQFEGLYPLGENILMLMTHSRNAVERHDFGLQFLGESAAAFADVGDEETAMALWTFLESYENPRLQVTLTKNDRGQVALKLEEIGLRTKGRVHMVNLDQSGSYIDRVEAKLCADAFVQRLMPIISEVQSLLLKHGILRRKAPRISPLGFITPGPDEEVSPAGDEPSEPESGTES